MNDEIELKADFLKALPSGQLDDSTFEQIEDALDRAEAPMQGDGDRWLTLPERIDALSEMHRTAVRSLFRARGDTP